MLTATVAGLLCYLEEAPNELLLVHEFHILLTATAAGLLCYLEGAPSELLLVHEFHILPLRR